MSSLSPPELVTDLDLIALDVRAATDFGGSPLVEKRRFAVTDWLRGQLEAYGYPASRHQTRRVPDAVVTLVSSVYADRTGEASSQDADDLQISSVFAGPASNALYVMSGTPYRGVFVGMAETVNAITAVASLTYWNGGAWVAPSSVTDGTQIVSGKSFSGGGLVSWALPEPWAVRAVNGAAGYWTRWTLSNTLTAGTAIGQLLPLSRSRLTYPAARYALALLYQEGQGNSRGQWKEKADDYFRMAQEDLTRVLPLVADEFDMDDSGGVDPTEVNSVVSGGVGARYTWERG